METQSKASVANVHVSNHGSVWLFMFATDAVQAWVLENVGFESWQMLGAHGLAVEHRFGADLVCVLRDAGFTVS